MLTRTKARLKDVKWGTVAAGFSAACALLVSAYTAMLQRQQVRAQVWPILQLGYNWSSDTGEKDDAGAPLHSMALQLSNDGIGPAIVRDVTASVDGHPARSWDEVMTALVPGSVGFERNSSHIRGAVISSGTVLKVFEPRSSALATQLHDGFARLQMSICYCSVLDECWRVERHGSAFTEPTPVGKCTTPPGSLPFQD